jgi:phospholipid transport system substrate-binding protein
MRRLFGTLLAASAAAALFALPVRAADPSKLIETVTTEVVEIVTTKTGADRQAAMRQVVQDNFDVPYMGRSALGTHWNQASEQQQARFLAAVETSEARDYSERLGKYAGTTVTIGKVTSRPNNVWIVDSRLNRTNGQPIKIEWQVHDRGQGLRIADVKVEGVSMFMTMRSDFNSYIQSNYGEVEPLVKELEARAARQ